MSQRKSIYMGTTQIECSKTSSQIANLLGQFGASTVQSSYDNGEVVGLAFSIPCGDKELYYKLPVRHEPILKLLKKHATGRLATPEQARRVAWRQVFRWIEAQVALIEVGMVEINEIFLPYMMRDGGKTLYDELIKDKVLLLENDG